MDKLFQIYEQDLAALEQDVPAIISRHIECMRNTDRAAIRRIQKILMDVRWNYGPPTEVERVEP